MPTAVRCLTDGAGEQAAGLCQRIRVDAAAFAQFGKGCPEFGIRFHRPFAQTAEEAILHLGRGGLGVGEAEDVLRFHPAQQQAGDAVGQDAGLARSGIGGQPGRGGGFGGLHLPFGGGLHHGCFPTGSAAGWAVVSHSPKRDRWS